MRTVEDYEKIRRAYFVDHLSIRAIHRTLGYDRETIRKAVVEAAPMPYMLEKPREAPVIGPYKQRIAELLMERSAHPIPMRRNSPPHRARKVHPDYRQRCVDRFHRAKRDLLLEQQLRHLDTYEVIILDDIGYVQQSRDEMEVLFTLLAERYERRSVIITSNLVFSQWEQIFKDPMTTAAAIDRVVHHSTIVEFGKEITSHRAQEAAQRIQQQNPE